MSEQIDMEFDKLKSKILGMTKLMFLSSDLGLVVNTGSDVDRGKYDWSYQASMLTEADPSTINAQDSEGRTALMYVAMGWEFLRRSGFSGARAYRVSELLKLGADPLIKDDLNKTALDYMLENYLDLTPEKDVSGQDTAVTKLKEAMDLATQKARSNDSQQFSVTERAGLQLDPHFK